MVDNVAVVDRGGAAPAGDHAINTSRPRIANSNIYNVEITNKFKEAAARLQSGTLVKDEHFTLFESVGALEIGDPKMDSGCAEDDGDLDKDFDVTKILTSREILWLMDGLLCHEVAWQMGYPLSQTLFTSYHIDSLLWPEPLDIGDAQFGRQSINVNSDALLHVLFRAYCVALIKCCDLTLTMVTSQHYYEEEDFATQLFNRDLLRRFSTETVANILSEAITWLNTAEIDVTTKSALMEHMSFRSNMLQAFESHAAVPPVAKSVRAPNLDTLHLRYVERQPVPGAFSPKIQRRLASSVPPRPMINISIDKALQFWCDNCRHMTDAFAVRSAQCSTDLITANIIFNAQHVQPSTYVRSLLQAFLSEHGKVIGCYATTEFMWDDLQRWTLTSSSLLFISHHGNGRVPSTHSLALQHCRDFMGKIERPFTNVFRTVCLNRSRLRRTLHHAILEWDQIQAEAEELDEEIQSLIGEKAQPYISGSDPTFSYPLSSWVYHFKLTQLRLLIQIGFELSIYAPYELGGMYWYLAHICDIHLAHLERISHFVAMSQHNIPALMRGTNLEHHFLSQCQITTQTLYREFSLLKAIQALSRSLHGCHTVVGRWGKQSTAAATSTYSSDDLRYEIRMRPFLHLSIPEPIGLAQFNSRSHLRNQSTENILRAATEYALTAKGAWEAILKSEWHMSPLAEEFEGQSKVLEELWTTDIKKSIKAGIAAGVAITYLQRKLTGLQDNLDGPQIKVDIPKESDRDLWHPFWIVPRIS